MLGAPLAHPFGAFCGVGGRGKTDVQGGAGPPSGTPRSVWDVGGAFGASLRGFLWCWRQREDGRARGGQAPPSGTPPDLSGMLGAPSAHPFGAFCGVGGRGKTDSHAGRSPCLRSLWPPLTFGVAERCWLRS